MKSWLSILLASLFTLLSCGQARHIYTVYTPAMQNQPRVTDLNRERLTFETQGLLFLGDELRVRFTLQNNSREKVIIDNVHTIEYEKTVGNLNAGTNPLFLCFDGPDKPEAPFFEIHPDPPSVIPSQVEPAETKDYILRYRIEADGCGVYVALFGIVVNYHIHSGELGRAKSEKVYLLDPLEHLVVAYDENRVMSEFPLVEAGGLHPKTKLDLHRAL